MISKEALEIIERKLKQGKRIELEYNHQTKEIKLLEHKITRIKIKNKGWQTISRYGIIKSS